MNIGEAKVQLKNALAAYFTRDKYGNFRIPQETQRPVFLMGPPGIGKTAIVRQVADEMNIGVVAYSITHHTRQSALGLPMIVTREYGGREYHVSEYTMSEIIGSVYDVIAESGAEEGILFLDEINCASETLTPVMLQFLQFKTFGRHHLPPGWIIVTAGNPPEYNRSARDFDIVTWDRLKRIDIEPDYQAWKSYALKHNVHGSVASYLDIRRENFYRIETTPERTEFVTARGWMDLSDMIHLYEENDLKVDKSLVIQYLQNDEVAGDFVAYYDLYNKYKSDYRIDEILSGQVPDEIMLRARSAGFDERLSLLGLLLGAVMRDFRGVIEQEDTLSELLPILRDIKQQEAEGTDCSEAVAVAIGTLRKKMEQTEKRGILTQERQLQLEGALAFLRKVLEELRNGASGFGHIRKCYDAELAKMRSDAEAASGRLKAAFGFINNAFGTGDELLIFITELTAGWYSARFISRYGSDEYYACSEQLAFHQRHLDLAGEIGDIVNINSYEL
ncbi:MAG: AAA family ATPase [Mogibacterium sp.]|nr:AAA family ATPase [Mogibacterium sp.]